MIVNYQNDKFDSGKLIGEMLNTIDNIEVSHISNWVALSDLAAKLSALNTAISENEKEHNEQMAKMMARIEELNGNA